MQHAIQVTSLDLVRALTGQALDNILMPYYALSPADLYHTMPFVMLARMAGRMLRPIQQPAS